MGNVGTQAETDLTALEKELLSSIESASDLAALDDVRVAALGKKGKISQLMKELGSLAPEQRKSFGQAINQIKQSVGTAIGDRKKDLEAAALASRLEQEVADVTLPTRSGALAEGRIHPISQVTEEIYEIFADMGFSIAEGPDIETDFNNFTALNIPPEHPARQEHDTFYFDPKPDGSRQVLRTHTSPVQIRTMLAGRSPDPDHCPRSCVSVRFRSDPYAHVPPGRGSGHRQAHPSGASEMGIGRILQSFLRG